MKRVTRLSLITALTMASAGIVLALWIALTPHGARWLLTSLLPISGISFTAEKVEGRLIGPLLLTRVRVGLAQRRVEIDRLELKWRPLQLFSRNLALQELTLAGVRIQDDTPPDNKPLSLAWPTLPAGLQRLDAKITQLRLTSFTYRRLQETPLLLTSFASSVTWQDGLLSLGKFKAIAPIGRINGSLSAGFKEPSLTADLAVIPTVPIGKMDRLSVLVRQKKETGPEPFVEIINLAGSAGSEKRLELVGEVEMAKDALNLRGIRLTRPGKKDLVTAEGSLAFSAGKSILTLQIEASDLDLSPELNVPTDLFGTLSFAGSFAGKETPFTGSVSGTLRESTLLGQPLTGELQADYTGNNLSITHLALKGKGFDLHASGELDQRLLLAARISDFSSLLPGSSGTLQADGWVCWRDGQLSGNLVGTGSSLAYAGTRLGAVDLNARRDQGTDAPVRLDASLREVDFEGYRLKSATVAAEGTVLRHSMNASLRSAEAEVRLHLSAGYKNGLWAGDLSRLEGSDSNGLWEMTAPAAFAVSSGKLSLSSLTLTANAAERLEVGVDLTLNPLRGQLRAQWNDLNLSRANPWLPPDTRLGGRINGQTKGIMIAGDRFELDGKAVISGGTLHRKSVANELNLTFPAATASWNWRGEALTGAFDLTLAEYGKAQTTFQLPLPARFPVAVNPQGPLRGTLSAQLQEKGVLAALFPELVQGSFGKLDADLAVSGSWGVPQVGGTLRLAKAGAYLPIAGIHLKEVEVAARLEKDLIHIDSFRALSGPGHIEGTALITLSGWRMISYQGSINGKNFQTVHLPELQILSTPQLNFSGTPQKLTLRGELRLPEVRFVAAPSQTQTAIEPSSDVIYEGTIVPVAKSPPLALDIQVRVILGERVFVKVAGIDAQLGGGVILSMSSLDNMTGSGEIKVVKGRFRTYGVNLEIVRGRLFFAGGPIDRPALDFLALRTIGDVRAGVTVGGTLQKPLIRLYSEPPMPDVDVLAYIVVGHPIGGNGEQADLVTRAAGALLSSGQAGVLQEQMKNRLGLSTLEIQSGVGAGNGAMGYKPLEVTPPGALPEAQQPGITETMLTVGKYLTPQIYISYGRSLFTGSNLFRLRYDIFKRWQIETQTGSESGADLFYKLEFK